MKNIVKSCRHCLSAIEIQWKPNIRHSHVEFCSVKCRLLHHVTASGDCWNMTSGTDRKGYGRLTVDFRQHAAHRLSWELHIGPIPSGKWVLHKCDNRACINPDHLFLGNAQDNVDDMHNKGRARKAIGAAHGKSKLTEAQVREILSSEEKPKLLAAQYGVKSSVICNIRARRIWRHVI